MLLSEMEDAIILLSYKIPEREVFKELLEEFRKKAKYDPDYLIRELVLEQPVSLVIESLGTCYKIWIEEMVYDGEFYYLKGRTLVRKDGQWDDIGVQTFRLLV